LIAAIALFTSTAGAADAPGRDELLKPAPNPAWNNFAVSGSDTMEIAPGLYTFRAGGTRNIFIVTRDGVIATDPMDAASAALYRAAIRKVTPKPVKYVVYSHEHWDHIRGAKIFKDEGAKIVAHANCAAHFKDVPNPEVVPPDITFTGNHTVKLGEHSLKLIYLGPNHGNCLVVMQPDVEDGKYMFVVDLMTPGGAPLDYMPDYAPLQWISSLKALEAMNFSVIIPGHGVPLADKSALTERRTYLEALMAAVKAETDAGTPINLVPDKVKLPQFAYLRGYDRNLRDNVRRMQTFYGIGW
jgi:glyoxylase-like metal-dependent hydrolase (beta-lactamase superfamily II)